MKQIFSIESNHKLTALEIAGLFDDAGIKKYRINEINLKDVQEEMTGLLEYIEE